jgi:hypothetical protein
MIKAATARFPPPRHPDRIDEPMGEAIALRHRRQ